MEELQLTTYDTWNTPETNMEHKSEGLEDDFPFQRVILKVPC